MLILGTLKTVEWAQVAAPALASVAAAAAWFSAITARRSLELARLPMLTGSWHNLSNGGPGVKLEIFNVGAGSAHDAYVLVISGGKSVRHEITDAAVLKPGERSILRIDRLPGSFDETTPRGILYCRDWAGRWQVWSWDGRHKRPLTWRRTSPKLMNVTKMLKAMYPKLDTDALERLNAPVAISS